MKLAHRLSLVLVRPRVAALVLAFLAAASTLSCEAGDPPGGERWVYASLNLAKDENVATLEALMKRAAAAGYGSVLLTDTKFAKLGDMDAHYFENVERIKKASADLHIAIVPAIFPIGYSDGLLWHDPNLAECLPVKEALFVVQGGSARPAADPPVSLRGGDFSDLSAWDVDPTVTPDAGAARVANPGGNPARLSQSVAVHPFRQYQISVRIKTDDFQGSPRISVLAGDQELNFAELGAKKTQDWTVHHVLFNSLEHDRVKIYLTSPRAQTGSLWWDDAALEETGLVNLVRREGAPFTVTRENGAALEEGRDFQPVADPLLGNSPYKGSFDMWHEPPAIATSLPEGTRLRVSYFHVPSIKRGQVMICPSEPKTLELLRDQMERVHKAWGASSYFMSHDEIRVLNQDDSCRRRNLDAGAILADNVRACAALVREIAPGARIFVWNDMFDPLQNARKDYYLVRGDLVGSWKGLDKDIIIANWNFGKRHESLEFFEKLGLRQILAGYYDDDVSKTRESLDAARGIDGILGWIYVTWSQRYDDLERFQAIAGGS